MKRWLLPIIRIFGGSCRIGCSFFRHFPVILGESDKNPCNYDYYNDGKGRKYPADLIAVAENTENIRRKFPKAVLAGMTMLRYRRHGKVVKKFDFELEKFLDGGYVKNLLRPE